jgi:hypothetical protein
MEAAAGPNDEHDADDVGSQDDDGSDPEDEGVDVKRDRCKKQKFDTLLAQNKLPNHITDMWFQGSKSVKNKRDFQTKIINNLFHRDTSGKLIMKPEAPFFSSYKQTVEKNAFKVEQVGVPRGVFKGMYFQNSEEALQEAIDNGEVEVVTQGGKDWYSFISLKKTHEVSKVSGQKVVGQQKKIDADACKGMDEAFEKLDWSFQPKARSESSIADAKVRHPQPLAIQDAPIDDAYLSKAEPLLAEAKCALERLQKELMKLAPLVASDPKFSTSVSISQHILIQFPLMCLFVY